jgi:hypothetical protein
MILDIIHRHVFYLKDDVSETEFCLLQMQPPQVRPIDRASFCLRTCQSIRPTWVGSTWWRRQNPVSETLYFKWKKGRLITSRIVTVILVYHHHKPIDSINLLGS